MAWKAFPSHQTLRYIVWQEYLLATSVWKIWKAEPCRNLRTGKEDMRFIPAEFPERFGLTDTTPAVKNNELSLLLAIFILQKSKLCFSAYEHNITSPIYQIMI